MMFGFVSRRIGSRVTPSLSSLLALWLVSLTPWVEPARAVVVIGTGDPAHNTTEPTGALAGSGWQWEGAWMGLAATVISPHHLVTASHVGGGAGEVFTFRGRRYLTTASYLAPGADIRVCTVAGTFPDYAPLYTGNAETGKGIVMIGAGGPRGDLVTVTAGSGKKLKGWLWTNRDGQFRWGTNTVSAVVGNGDPLTRSPLPGDLLACFFDASAGNDEATLTVGDSGGGVFLKDAGQWKLAGILRAVESTFRYSAAGADFSAAVFDKGGLYQYNGSTYELVPSLTVNRPTVFYAARIAGSADWFKQVLDGTMKAEYQMFVESSDRPDGPFTADSTVTLDLDGSRFVAKITDTPRFYRIAEGRFNFTGFRVEGDQLYLSVDPN